MRYALGLEYDGGAYSGWQRQSHSPSVQQEVERSLAEVANHEVTVFCAGRTDTGVHARGQVVHFDSPSTRTDRQWMLGINSHLPDDIRAVWIKAVDDDFHARFGAYSRSYQYRIINRWVRPAIEGRYYGWCREPLNENLMHEAAQCLIGRHDFSAFQSAGCSAQHAIRDISNITVRRNEDIILLDISANAFLYHMVRNISGSLIAVGLGEKSPEWFKQIFLGGDRKLAGVMAESNGLCFMSVRYDPKYNLPEEPEAFPFRQHD
jgi:tRNA pseudouridine38-40 synthase